MPETTIEVKIEDGEVCYEPRDWPQLDPGDNVVWSFRGLPDGCNPCLLFTEFPDGDRNRIPFESFASEGCRVTGRSFNGTPGLYRYQFGLTPETGRDAVAIQLAYGGDFEAGGLSARGGPGGSQEG